MTANHPPTNPLFASPSPSALTIVSPSRRASQAAAKLGGYGGMAVAAWLVTAVATGYGVAAADTTGASSESSSSSSASSTSTGESSDGSTATSTTGTSNSSAATTTGGSTSNAADTTADATSSRTQVAPGVTISSSGGAHTSTTDPGASTAPESTSGEPLEETSGVETQPEPSERSGETTDPSVADTPPVTPGSENAQTTAAPAKTESNLTRSAVTINAATSSVSAHGVVATEEQPSATVTESTAVPSLQASKLSAASNTPADQSVATAATRAASTAQITSPATGFVGLLNSIVVNLLNPFLAPAPDTGNPFTPVTWAVLGWVRRNLFNQAPTINPNPTTTQTGQTVTGILATDPEGDRLTYTVTQPPENGILTIDQATNTFTFTPKEINYDAPQDYSFRVSVADGKFNLLSLFRPHSDEETITVTVKPPTVEREILQMPDGITNPLNPRFSEDGESIFFSASGDTGRGEIYRIDVDGFEDGFECITCGVAAPPVRQGVVPNLGKPIPFTDGSGRILVRVGDQGSVVSGDWAVLEVNDEGNRQLVPIITPQGNPGAFLITPQREMRISPDGMHVAFSQLVLNSNPQHPNFRYVGINAVIGTLDRTAAGYEILDPVVIYDIGEVKQFTPDGQGVVILGGQYEIGNLDDVVVNLDDGTVTRVTANLDYDEDMDYSPNQQWIAIGSTRTLDALTPMTQIVRPGFLLPNIYGVVYEFYADPVNLSNHEWLVAAEDELERENGIPLFVVDDPSTTDVDEGDDYTARSMPSWNPTGDAVTFWESNVDVEGNPTGTRLVVANLKYTTSGPAANPNPVTPNYRDWGAPSLSTYVPTPPQPPFGPRDEPYIGAGGGTAVVSEVTGQQTAGDPNFPYPGPFTVRTVTYDDYVNEDGLVLNGWESTTTNGSQSYIGYRANITATDADNNVRGYLIANGGPSDPNGPARVLTTQTGQIYVGNISSELDGRELTLMDPERLGEAVGNA